MASISTSNPSATSTIIKNPAVSSPAGQTFVNNQLQQPIPTYGSSVTDSLGRTGTALYNPNSGAPLDNPANQNTGTSQSGIVSSQPTASTIAYQKYLDSLQPSQEIATASSSYNDYIANQQKSIAGLAGRDAGVPLTIVRGQQEKLLNQTNPEATRLQNAIGIAQTQRNQNIDLAKAGLDYATKQQELSKPVFGQIGTIGYQLNPQTNQYESIGGTGGDEINTILGQLGAAGVPITSSNRAALIQAIQDGATPESIIAAQASAAGTKANATAKTQLSYDAYGNPVVFQPTAGNRNVSAISSNTSKNLGGFSNIQAVKDFQTANGLTPDGVVGPKTITAMTKAGLKVPATNNSSNSTTIQSPSMSFPKANNASITQQITYADSVQRAFNTANDNLSSLTEFMNKAGVNSASTVPLVNTINNKIKLGVLDPGTQAAFMSALQGLRSEYAQVLSRGGEVTDSSRKAAVDLIPDNLTPAQLQQVANRLNIEGTNAIKEANSQIQTITNRVSGKSSTPSTKNPLGI